MRKRKMVNTSEPKLLNILYGVRGQMNMDTIPAYKKRLCILFKNVYNDLLDGKSTTPRKNVLIKYSRFRNWITYNGRKLDADFYYTLHKAHSWSCDNSKRLALLNELITELEGEQCEKSKD
jgi:hypothetical protein